MRGWTRPVSLALFLLAAAALGPALSEHLITVAITTLFMILLAIAWNLVLGYAGQFSLGHSVFVGVGAYTSTVLYTKAGLTPWIGMLAAGLLAAGVAVILGLVGLGLAVTAALERSRFGYAVMALREDELAAEATGTDTYGSKVAVMGLSAFLTGLGGTFYAQFYLYISPEIGFAFEHQLNMLMGTMIGGAGTLWGPVVGTTIFSFLSELMRNLPFQSTRGVVTASKMVYAALLMLIIIFLPGGIMSLRLRRGARRAPGRRG